MPYVIDADETDIRFREIRKAMYTYERFTCLRFVPMVFYADGTSTYDDYDPPLSQGYVRFVSKNEYSGCASWGCGKMHEDEQKVACCACLR